MGQSLLSVIALFRLESVVGFRAELQHRAPSGHVRQLARQHHANNVEGLPDTVHEQSGRLTPPITATDLRHVPDLYRASTAADATVEVSSRRLWSASGQGDLRATGLNEQDEADMWLVRALHGNQTTSSEEDQTSKGDTEDELSK